MGFLTLYMLLLSPIKHPLVMKNIRILSILLLALLPSLAKAQGKIKLYVYTQKVLPGARQITANIGDPNVTEKTPAAKTNYLIYLWQKKASELIPSEIWIDKKPYSVSIETLEPGPVMENGPAAEGKILVPGGSARLLKLTLTGLGDPNQPRSKKLNRCLRKAEAILVYQVSGKQKLVGAKKIMTLESVPMQ